MGLLPRSLALKAEGLASMLSGNGRRLSVLIFHRVVPEPDPMNPDEIDADRFYVPPYMGPSGWVGVQITGKPPWDIVEEVIREGHRMGAAPKAKTRLRAGVPAKPSATSKASVPISERASAAR